MLYSEGQNSCAYFAFWCCYKTSWQNSLGGKGFFQPTTLRSSSISDGQQPRNQSRNPQAETEAETTEESNWCSPHDLPSSFLIFIRTTYLGRGALPTVSWSLPRSLIKKILHRFTYRQSFGGNLSIKVPSSQTTLIFVKLKQNKTKRTDRQTDQHHHQQQQNLAHLGFKTQKKWDCILGHWSLLMSGKVLTAGHSGPGTLVLRKKFR